MEDKKAVTILLKLLNKQTLNKEEKEAVLTAIGILGWTSLAEGKIKELGKTQKAKRAKSARW